MKIKFSSHGNIGSRVMAASWKGHVAHWYEHGDEGWAGTIYKVVKDKKRDETRLEVEVTFKTDSMEQAEKLTTGYVTALENAKDLGRLARATVDLLKGDRV